MNLRQSLLGLLAISSLTVPAMAAPFQNATVRRILDGKEVFIDKTPARVDQTAGKGQELSTGKSRAELLFDRRALGFLGNNSLIKLGEECFRLDKGQVLINGPQNSCLGTKVLGIRGTTYVLNALNEGGYRLSVLSGEAIISDQGIAETDQNSPDILEQYPRLNPVIGFGSSAWGSNASGTTLGQAAGLILGDASFSYRSAKARAANFFITTQQRAAISTPPGERAPNLDTNGSTPTIAASAPSWWAMTAGRLLDAFIHSSRLEGNGRRIAGNLARPEVFPSTVATTTSDLPSVR